MKNTVACILTFLFIVTKSAAQNVEGFRALEIRYGRTGTKGDLFTIAHERYFAERLNLLFAGSAEFSKAHLINYHSYSIEVIAQYFSNVGFNTNGDLELKGGVGLTANHQTEPNLYKGYSFLQRTNYGIVFNLTGEWAFTDDLSLTLSGNQRLYKKKELGMFQYDLSVGLKWKIWH
jgi:hypothetical protein